MLVLGTGLSAQAQADNHAGALEIDLALKSRLISVEGATRDADGEPPGRRTRIGELELELEVEYAPAPDWRLYTELSLGQDLAWHRPGGSAHEGLALTIDQAWVEIEPADANWSLRVGRQTYEDRFRWLFDDELDALNLEIERGDLALQAAFGQQQLVDGNLLGHEHIEPVNYYYAELRQRRGDAHEVAVYLLARDDLTERRDSPVLLGLRAELQPLPVVNLQVNAALARGHDGDASVRGYGADMRVRLTAHETPGSPRLTLGVAWGSGDSDPDDSTDRSFRQSGFAGNAASLGGLAEVQYYGELFDPELANLRVLSAGIGIDLTTWVSLDLVHHRYQQQVASDELRDAGIDAEPAGESRQLGSETDLVLGLEFDERLEARLALGWFQPGSAFDDARDDVWSVDLELSYSF